MSTNSMTAASTLGPRYYALMREAARAILDGLDQLAQRLYGKARVIARQALQIGNRDLLLDYLSRNL